MNKSNSLNLKISIPMKRRDFSSIDPIKYKIHENEICPTDRGSLCMQVSQPYIQLT